MRRLRGHELLQRGKHVREFVHVQRVVAMPPRLPERHDVPELLRAAVFVGRDHVQRVRELLLWKLLLVVPVM